MNEQLIEEFCNALLSQSLSDNRIKKYRYTLSTISKRIGKPFQKCNRKDLEKFFADIQKSDYKENTRRDFKVVVKKFWRWLKKMDKGDPEETAWIKTTKNMRLQKLIRTQDVLTEEEVYKLVDVAMHARDKAIISLIYETGSRIGEVMGLKIGDIVYDDRGYSFVSNGKTGDVYKRVVNEKAVQLLKDWLNQHPLKNDANAPLWVTLARSHTGIKQMNYAGFNKMLREVATIAGITKKIHLHGLRHARITNLRVERKVPDAIIETIVGWTQGSNMFKTYSHTSAESVDKALSEAYGLKEEQAKRRTIAKLDDMLASDGDFRKKVVKLLFDKGVKL